MPINEYIQEKKESEIDKAIRKLASIADFTKVTEDMRKSAGFMLEAKYRDDHSRFIQNLQERLLEAEIYAKESYNRGVEDSIELIKKQSSNRFTGMYGEFARAGYDTAINETIDNINKLKTNK